MATGASSPRLPTLVTPRNLAHPGASTLIGQVAEFCLLMLGVKHPNGPAAASYAEGEAHRRTKVSLFRSSKLKSRYHSSKSTWEDRRCHLAAQLRARTASLDYHGP